MAVSDWSSDADNNTSIDGINIGENCAPGNLNNAIRSVMAAIASLFSPFWLSLISTTTSAATVLQGLGGAASGANADITSLQSSCAVTTQVQGDNSTKIASTAYVDTSGFGHNQTWQNVTASRASGGSYTNSTTKPIQVLVALPDTQAQSPTVTVVVGGIAIIASLLYDTGNSAATAIPSFIVPAGATYSVSWTGSSYTNGAAVSWCELR